MPVVRRRGRFVEDWGLITPSESYRSEWRLMAVVEVRVWNSYNCEIFRPVHLCTSQWLLWTTFHLWWCMRRRRLYSELMAKEGPEVMIGDGPEGDRSNRMAKQARRNRALSKRKQSA
ncbi:unnamed protein product [Microthlaspi erraticum]|uniref:Uncharacterized protein n=1 Tax=Microthlaspi erraticum TaxID=1685480 RepID=A0A6D2IDX1_9BRAS|nr:unnamed protein product [Microthlaspi erraticum]